MKPHYFLLIACLISLTFISCSKKEKVFTIGYVQLTDDASLDDAKRGVIESLKQAGFEDGKNIEIDFQSAQGDLANVPMILRSFKNKNVDMVMTATTPCMLAALQYVKDIPVVFTVAFGPHQVGVKDPPKNLTGAYDPIDMNVIFGVMNEIKPVTKLGIIYNSSEANAILGRDRVKEECTNQNIHLEEATITNSSEVYQAASALAYKKVDAFIVATDNTVNSVLESVVKVSLQSGIPIYDTEASHVHKGALAGLGINNYDWGVESGKIAARIIKGEKAEDIPMAVLTNKKLVLNQQTADKLGIKFSETLLTKADEVIK